MATDTITLRQIARKVGVSVGTVSRALARETGVSDQRARAIQDLAVQMGYRPQPLRRRRTGAIAILVGTAEPGHPDEDWSQRLVVLATQVAAQISLHVHLEFVPRNGSGEPAHTPPLPTVVQENRVDGVLLAGHPHQAIVDELHARQVPMVMIGGSAETARCSCVNPDRSAAATAAIHRLYDLGHRRFGTVLSDRRYPSTEIFYQVCRQAVEELGLELAAHDVLDRLQPNLGGGVIAGRRYLASRQPLPTAILCTNDWMALGLTITLLETGRRLPEDVSIVGQDNLPWCNQLEPALSSIDNREEQMVREALAALCRCIERRDLPPRDIAVHAELVWRGSCGPAKSAGAAGVITNTSLGAGHAAQS